MRTTTKALPAQLENLLAFADENDGVAAARQRELDAMTTSWTLVEANKSKAAALVEPCSRSP